MTISTHHHFKKWRCSYKYSCSILKEMGVKNIVGSHLLLLQFIRIIKYLEDGTIHHIEGSMNGSLGKFASEGKMKGVGVLRSHGGRYQSVQDGEVHIDIAVIAAPTADAFGNATGDRGNSACGLLGFALGDSQYADKVIVVTDNLVPFPFRPWQIQGNYVDYVVQIEKLESRKNCFRNYRSY